MKNMAITMGLMTHELACTSFIFLVILVAAALFLGNKMVFPISLVLLQEGVIQYASKAPWGCVFDNNILQEAFSFFKTHQFYCCDPTDVYFRRDKEIIKKRNRLKDQTLALCRQ